MYNNTLSGNALADTAAGSAAIGVGTFRLADTRETVADGGLVIDGVHYKDYLVRRLADGNCWMVQNLDLNLKTFAGTNNLTSENTNLNSKSTWDPSAKLKDAGGYANHLSLTDSLEPGPGYDTVGALSINDYQFQSKGSFGPNLYWGSRYQEGTTTDNSGTANNNGLVITNNANSSYARSYDNGLGYLTGTQNVKDVSTCVADTTEGTSWISACQQNGQIGNVGGSLTSVTGVSDGLTVDSSRNSTSITSNTDTTFTMRGSVYIGDYYNWYAATAESGQYSTTNQSIQDDICPKGWRLPVNSGEGSWDNLIKTKYALTSEYGYSSNNRKQLNKLMQLPFSIPFAGYYEWTNGALNNRGGYGYYWSSTATRSATNSNYLSINYGGFLYAQNSNNKVYGFTIRCVSHGDELKSTESQTVLASATTCSAGKICYNANGGTGTMSDQSASASSSVVLTAPTFVRTGYSFAGWSTQDNDFGTVYGPNETITTPSTLGSTGLQLYAKWLPSSGTMQDFTSTQCDALGIHQSVALTDNRDGNTYTVTKLKDGNCWMTTNLALNLADFAGTHKLNSTNTDIGNNNASNTALAPCTSGDDCYDATENGYYWDPEASTRKKWEETYKTELESRNLPLNFTGLSELLLGQAQPNQFQSADQTGYWWGSKVSDDGEWTPHSAEAQNADRVNGNAVMPRSFSFGGVAGFGDLYNWFAAVAESGSLDSAAMSSASDSICPSNWSLPNYADVSTDAGFSKLVDTYSLAENRESFLLLSQSPHGAQLNGYISLSSGGFFQQDNYGYYWSSTTANGNTHKQALGIQLSTKSVLFLNSNFYKSHGYSVRCVLRK